MDNKRDSAKMPNQRNIQYDGSEKKAQNMTNRMESIEGVMEMAESSQPVVSANEGDLPDLQNYCQLIDKMLDVVSQVATVYEGQKAVFIEVVKKYPEDASRRLDAVREECHQSLTLMQAVLAVAYKWMTSDNNQLPELFVNDSVETNKPHEGNQDVDNNIPEEVAKPDASEDPELEFLKICVENTTAFAKELRSLSEELHQRNNAIKSLNKRNISNMFEQLNAAVKNIVVSIKAVVKQEYGLLKGLNENWTKCRNGGQGSVSMSTAALDGKPTASASGRVGLSVGGYVSSSTPAPASSSNPSAAASSSSSSPAAAPIRLSTRISRSTRRLSPNPSQKSYKK